MGGTLALVLLALLALLFALHASLPRLDGRMHLAGLAAPASIRRDALGTAVVQAANRLDAARALGFVHAQERYFEMDLARRSGLEKVEAEFIGEQAGAMHMFAMLGFSELWRKDDYVKDMQAISHDYVLMGLDMKTDEEYAGVG